jgi:hypothetical protein
MWYDCCVQTLVLAMLALSLTKSARGHIMIKLKTAIVSKGNKERGNNTRRFFE